MKADFTNTSSKKMDDLMNLHLLDVTEHSHYSIDWDFPCVFCPPIPNIDYLCLYGEVRNYNRTKNTAVCFYQYDKVFDGIKGLYNAIYYHNEKLLNRYKDRFKNVKYVIEPDYSQCGDLPFAENFYRCFKARIVNVWLTIECSCIVIPNISFCGQISSKYIFSGIKQYSTVAMSTKGLLKSPIQKELLKLKISETINKLHPNSIVVYADCNFQKIDSYFEEAKKLGTKIIIPKNLLLERNDMRRNYYGG